MYQKTTLPQHWIYAHVYNRGVDKRIIYRTDADRSRFMLTMRVVLLEKTEKVSLILHKREKHILASMSQKHLLSEYGPTIVDILAFCLMPNHYHIVVRAHEYEQIAKFAQRLGNSHTKYFNTTDEDERKGRLFESKYQMREINTDEQLIHTVRYVHTNPSNAKSMHLTPKQLKKYQWSSLPAYLNGESKMCEIDPVLSHFRSVKDFWEFTKAGIQIDEPVDEDILIDAND